MKTNMKSKKVVTDKVLQEFLGTAKRGRISMANWHSKYQSIINSLANTLLFAIKDVPLSISNLLKNLLSDKMKQKLDQLQKSERGDVPGWVLVVLMTTGLVTGIWTVAQPRLSSILKNSLDNMNSIR